MPTVMVVEDEYKLRELVRSYLELAALTVLSTASGAQALSFAQRNPIDLVILDLGLPDVPGEEVAREFARHLGRSHPDAHRKERGAGPHRWARNRGRRLSDQALQSPRAGPAGPSHPPPRTLANRDRQTRILRSGTARRR